MDWLERLGDGEGQTVTTLTSSHRWYNVTDWLFGLDDAFAWLINFVDSTSIFRLVYILMMLTAVAMMNACYSNNAFQSYFSIFTNFRC